MQAAPPHMHPPPPPHHSYLGHQLGPHPLQHQFAAGPGGFPPLMPAGPPPSRPPYSLMAPGGPLGLPPGMALPMGGAHNQPRRKNATRENTQLLKAWLGANPTNPYPTKNEKVFLAICAQMSMTQVSTWFANARRRLKKENKMTWSPRNRCDDDDDDEDVDLDDEDADSANNSDFEDNNRHHGSPERAPSQQQQQQQRLSPHPTSAAMSPGKLVQHIQQDQHHHQQQQQPLPQPPAQHNQFAHIFHPLLPHLMAAHHAAMQAAAAAAAAANAQAARSTSEHNGLKRKQRDVEDADEPVDVIKRDETARRKRHKDSSESARNNKSPIWRPYD